MRSHRRPAIPPVPRASPVAPPRRHGAGHKLRQDSCVVQLESVALALAGMQPQVAGSCPPRFTVSGTGLVGIQARMSYTSSQSGLLTPSEAGNHVAGCSPACAANRNSDHPIHARRLTNAGGKLVDPCVVDQQSVPEPTTKLAIGPATPISMRCQRGCDVTAPGSSDTSSDLLCRAPRGFCSGLSPVIFTKAAQGNRQTFG